ncbi:SRPBCC domain-containing protein [Rhizobium sp. S96]|uniref:SRPBCC domain-containing protein n=1 Tax=Rhizobium sp. S96 TaxID=3055140 RepID=UPI0025AAB9D7|nr:SRPBCC domain-containing protein [Rhizobium sp. S96]MDM9620185.1 SRPBCC domain-containing protein [Rhizobium sp. S96]
MSLGIRIGGRIGRPVAEVFDAVVNPKKLSGYFTTIGGASAPLVQGTTVTWWKDAPVEVVELVPERKIVLRWDGGTGEDKIRYKTLVEMTFEPLDDGGTMVTISENGWRDDEAGRRGTYLNCEGWTQMLCCMKAFVEYGINLREGFFQSEMRGEQATAPEY